MTLELQWTKVKWHYQYLQITPKYLIQDHRILLEKLQYMNFAKNTIKIIFSYLIERYQYVQVEDKRSTLFPMFLVYLRELY